MAGVTANAVALVALLSMSMLVPSVLCAVDYSTSAARSYTSGWLSGKATWYGQPYGAGPDDNGRLRSYICDGGTQQRELSRNNAGGCICRWCLRLQEREPVPVIEAASTTCKYIHQHYYD